MAKSEMAVIDPAALLASLDVEQLESLYAARKKDLEAVEVLLRAARVLRDGRPPRKVRRDAGKPKPPKSAGEPVPVRADGDQALRARVMAYLTQNGSARPAIMANDLGVQPEAVLDVLNGNPNAFHHRGAGYWALRA